MELAERLRFIMQRHSLNAAEFADKLNVQRSNISHLLTGRNKPSVDFLSKLLTTFPSINIKWLITGTGNHNLDQPDTEHKSNTEWANKTVSALAGETFIKADLSVETKTSPESKKVTKVILIYNDNTFDVY